MVGVRALILAFAVSLAGVIPSQAQDMKDQVVELEKKAWEAWKNGDQKTYSEMTGNPAIRIYGGGIVSGKENFVSVEIRDECGERSYALEGIEVHKITDDVYAITYSVQLSQTCNDARDDTAAYTAAVWAKQGEAWKTVLLAEADVYEAAEKASEGEASNSAAEPEKK